ncbi:MAG: hypothetical protein S4CHLAM6_13610 [Chlamydiae bacterium]|nr:hypothetical protein [Chlamydiota bacterium]
MREEIQEPSEKKSNFLAILGWCIFDWGQSAFPTVIVTFVFGTYFVRSVAASSVQGTALWGWTIGLSSVIVASLSPLLGSIADHTGRRKVWLITFVGCNVFATSMLYFTHPRVTSILWALIFLCIANTAYEFMQVFYNAMLPAIAPKSKIGRISGWGWAFGYFGGLACLSIALFAFIQGGWISSVNEVNVRSSTLLVAGWVLAFSVPLLLFTNDLIKDKLHPIYAIKLGMNELKKTIKELKNYQNIFTFLMARLIYIDGLNTLFVFAGIYAGAAFKMNYFEILMFAMLINVFAGIGAAYFAWVDDKLGPKFIICLSLVAIIFSGSALLLIRSKSLFWLLSAILGLFVGPVQSASRSYMARIVPKHLTNQMFGIYQFSGRVTSFVGPVLVASMTQIFNSQRAGMSIIFVLMFVGLLVMTKVPSTK